MSFAIIALLGLHSDGSTDELSTEAGDLDQALDLIKDLMLARPDFRAITLVHIEDYLPIMSASEIMGEARRMDEPGHG